MKTAFIIIGGIAFLACAYYYNKRKHAKAMTPEQALDRVFDDIIKTSAPEEIERLSMDDVVLYFKGLKLRKSVDLPLIAQSILNNRKIYLLATYNEETESIENHKLIMPESATEDLLSAIGEEKLIILN